MLNNVKENIIGQLNNLVSLFSANIQGYSEYYREVVRENRISIEGSKKAPDYSFRIGGVCLVRLD